MARIKIQLLVPILMGILPQFIFAAKVLYNPRDASASQTTFVNVYNNADCGDDTYLIQIGVEVGSIGPTNCPATPSDHIFGGERPDGTWLVYLSPPSQIFDAGEQLIICTPSANNEDQCGRIS